MNRRVTSRNKRSWKDIKKIKFRYLVVGALLFSKLVLVLQISTSGSVLLSLEEQRHEQVKFNTEMRDGVVKSTSLVELEQKSDQVGFMKPEKSATYAGVHFLPTE